MRILLLNGLFAPYSEYGAERSVRLLAQALSQRDHDVRVLTTCPKGEERTERSSPFGIRYLESRNIFWGGARAQEPILRNAVWHVFDTWNHRMRRAVNSELKAWRPDVFHTNNLAEFSVSAWAAAADARVPIVHSIRDYYLLCPRSTMYHKNRVCRSQCATCVPFSILRQHATRFVTAVSGPSDSILQTHRCRGLFPNAVHWESTQNISLIQARFDETCPPTGLPMADTTKAVHLGFLGRLTHDKGLPFLLDAVAEMNRQQPGAYQLTVAGTGPLESQLRLATETYDWLRYVGYVDPAVILPHLSVLVVPSLWSEPSGNVIREAYGYGIPVVGSNVGGIPELIRLVSDDLVFEPAVGGDLQRAIEAAVLKRRRSDLEERARAAGRLCAPDHVCAQMERIYSRAIEGR